MIARLLALALTAATLARASLWVSPAGDDRNPGTEEQPLRTIERARDLVRTLNRDMPDDITVFLAGKYRVSAPIEFGPEDSGTNGFAVVYTAAPGEHPAIGAGYRVDGWTLADRSRNLWWAPAPEGLVDSRDLFVNGVPASRTRGRLVQAFAKDAAETAAEAPDPRTKWKNPLDVFFPPADPSAIWSEREGTPPFFVENAFELLGTPGEWYFDRQARRLYYTPREGEDMASADVEAAAAEALIVGKGTRARPLTGLIFKGIRFEFTTSFREAEPGNPGAQSPGNAPSAIRFSYAGSVQFLEDDFVHLGTEALDLGPGFRDGTIEGCVFGDIAWTAVRVANASQVRIDNCRFSYVSILHNDGAAIDADHSDSVVIEHDQIDHFPRFAILPQGSLASSNRGATNLISPPAIDFDGRPEEGNPRESKAPNAGISAAYQAVQAKTICAATVPRPPGNVSAASGDRFAYVTWDPPCLDGGSPVASYTVASSGGAKLTVSAAEFQAVGYAVFGGLENGHAINFTVAAVNATGASPASLPTANVIPRRKKKLKPPLPPKTASVATGDGEARFQISPPPNDGGSPVIAYSFAPVPFGVRVMFEGWDVVHPDPTHPLVRAIRGFPLGSGMTVAIAAINAAGEGKPAILKLQR